MARKFALIIGNSEYKDPALTWLKAPDADVQTLASVLRDPNIGAFDDVQVFANANESDVRRMISRFFSEKKREDLLLLYFSGHGVLDENGRLHLAVKDTERNLLAATSIPATFINERMDDCRSRRKILILDCCHSGAWEVGVKGDTPAVTADTFQGYGRVVMTASDKTQYALEGNQVVEDLSLSLFTHYLVDGLVTGKADKGEDGLIDVDEWYDFAREQVISQTTQQKPKIWMFDTEGELVIARNPNPPQLGSEDLPEELKLAIQSPFVAVRADAVEELKRLLLGSNLAISQAAFQALEELATHDDSRRIANAAGAALTAHDPLWHLREPAEPESFVADRQAAEKAEQERQAKERAEAERQAAEKAEAERLARLKAEQERIAQEAAASQPVTYLPFSGELRPQKFKASETAEVLIEVSGQAPESFSVDFVEPSGELTFAPPSAQLTVQPGYNAAVKFRADLRQRPLFKLNPAIPFSARVAASTGEVQALSGEVLVKPRVPLWSLPIVAVIAIIIILIGVNLAKPGPSAPGEVSLSAIDPKEAPLDQEVQVGISGSGFEGASGHTISIGELETLDSWVESDEMMRAVIRIPEDAEPGVRDVAVSLDFDGEHKDVSLEAGFSVLAPQVVEPREIALSSIEWRAVEWPVSQEVQVAIFGSGFGGATGHAISIGEFETLDSWIESDEVIRAVIRIPEGSVDGPHDLQLSLDFDGEQRLLSATDIYVPFLGPAPTEALESGGNLPEAGLRIAFASQQDGNWEIYVMDGDGSNLTRLTDDPADDGSPVWSPDGSQILFHSDRAGNFDIYVMNADGSGLTPLTDDPKADTFPAWSPDGKKIVFQSKRDGDKEIYLMNADGSDQTRLTNTPSDESFPSFSTRSGTLKFVSDRDGNLEIYWMHSDGSEQTRVTWNEYEDNFPVWSPTENVLAFTSVRDGNQEIYILDYDSGDEWELTGDTSGEDHPRWSPDGRYLVYDATHGPGSNGGVDSEIYIFDYWAEQATPIRLTDNDVDDDAPAVK